jgi:hypothetical protein
MTARNDDFLDRFRQLERKVRMLEINSRAYMETVIVGGPLTTSTIIPPFFTPFGGVLVAVWHSLLGGAASFNVEHNDTVFDTFTVVGFKQLRELEESQELEEGDTIQVVFGSVVSGTPSGLSMGFIVEP